MMKPKDTNSTCENEAIAFATTTPSSPARLSPKAIRTESSSTGSTSPSANAPKNECGMMCSTKSANPVAPACLVNFAATDGSSVLTETCMPTPGWISDTAISPASSASTVSR